MDLVKTNQQGNNITTSLIVAQVFGKEHAKVVRDIESLHCSDDFRSRQFWRHPYTHPQNGQTYHYYEMTKDGFSFLVMGYSGQKAGEFKENFIAEFNKREALLKSDDYILLRSQQILTKRIEAQEKQIERLQQENQSQQTLIEQQAPLVAFAQTITTSNANIRIGDFAKILSSNGYNIGQNRMFEWLRANKFLDERNIPLQKYMEMKLFVVEEKPVGYHSDGRAIIRTTTRITPKGQEYIITRLNDGRLYIPRKITA